MPDHPHQLGHRERLRERALKSLDAVPDYELLELFLFRTFPRGDIKPVAKALLTRFGSLGAITTASVEDLRTVPGVGEQAALDLRLLGEVTLRVGRETIRKRTVIGSWSALLAYVKVALANEPREQFRVLFLDNKNQLILDEIQNRGTVDHAPVYAREVMRRALELSASSVILVHNHPSGDPTSYVPFWAVVPPSGWYWRRMSIASTSMTISSVIAWMMSRFSPWERSGHRACRVRTSVTTWSWLSLAILPTSIAA
jgi:DNA repair protein RadC